MRSLKDLLTLAEDLRQRGVGLAVLKQQSSEAAMISSAERCGSMPTTSALPEVSANTAASSSASAVRVLVVGHTAYPRSISLSAARSGE